MIPGLGGGRFHEAIEVYGGADCLHFEAGRGRITGLRNGDRITLYYDLMIAKAITRGKTRGQAIERMLGALGEIEIEGVSTNLAFLGQVLRDPVFREGLATARYVEKGSYKLEGAGVS